MLFGAEAIALTVLVGLQGDALLEAHHFAVGLGHEGTHARRHRRHRPTQRRVAGAVVEVDRRIPVAPLVGVPIFLGRVGKFPHSKAYESLLEKPTLTRQQAVLAHALVRLVAVPPRLVLHGEYAPMRRPELLVVIFGHFEAAEATALALRALLVGNNRGVRGRPRRLCRLC